MKNIKIDINEIIKNEGVTLNANGERFASNNGFMVSLYGMEYKTEDKEEARQKIKDYINYIQDRQGLFVGVWLEQGCFYVDISIHIIDKGDALEVAKKNKQIAIFDLKNNNSIYLKDYNFIKYYNIYKIIRDNNNNIINYELRGQKEKIKELINYFESNIKTIRNATYNNLQDDYKQILQGGFIIIRDYEVIL